MTLIITKDVTNDVINLDLSKFKFMKKSILNVINITAEDGGIGIYFKECEVTCTLPNSQSKRLIPAIKKIKSRSNSLLLMI